MSKKIEGLTEEIAQPIVDELNLELVDVEFVKEGKNNFLRVYIDKAGGVDLEDCEQVSEKLSERLDEDDPIEPAYFLEVSSPGAERKLKTKEAIREHIGSHVYIKTYEPFAGNKEFYGDLVNFENDFVHIRYREKTREKEIEIPYEKIALARLAVSFN
ncbi:MULTISPECIES: ribosome maturation factor RimP [Allobacillus]|uniref:Ribosome maturation factor RimP n=1 Tax=Allobacillus salarius TaxID=1955272 RepID=A0A556PS20_9BACI|nr:ribosome maturation factor RimP [Allobacillus salarius]TSJ67188.1 ribosome maturation factor RimP [Allobacillus salarius]